MQEQRAPINFLELSGAYREHTAPHIRARRHMLVQKMDENYYLGRGVTDEIREFMEARGRPIGKSMLHQDSLMHRAIAGYLKGDRRDIDGRFHPILEHLAADEIRSWEDVERLVAERGSPQVDIDDLLPPIVTQAIAETIIVPETELELIPQTVEEDLSPRLVAFAEEDVNRVRERILQTNEDMTGVIDECFAELGSAYAENYRLREQVRLLEGRLRRVESGGSIEEIAGIPLLLEQVERTRRQLQRAKLLRDLPQYSEYYKRRIVFHDRFVREFEKLAATEHPVVIRQMDTCFNLNPFHSGLNTQTVRQTTIPNTNPGDSLSRASEGLRFTWRATESHIEILWIMPREDLP